uniref:Uncharacterized protein n=1 Tax=Magallana gigas TaxID=29159 RepID=K1QYP6_MAGGI
MSLEDISTLYAEDLAVTADEEDARHPDKILEHSEENCKFTAEIRVFSQLMAQMMRKMDEQRDGVYGQTVVLLKLQTDKMAVDLRDLRNIVAETREKYSTRHPPSEDSDYNESIINVTSLYPGSEEVVKLTNFLEEMKSQQDSEVSKGTGTEQLPTDSSEEDALVKNEDGSGVIINNTREDNVKMINLIPETVKDSKFANFQEEMQAKLDNGISNKGIKILLANESVEDSSAMDDRKSVVTNNTEDNGELRNLNPETVGAEMQGELDNGMAHKVAESTVPMKESVEDATAKGDGSSVILDKNTEEVTEQKPTKKNDEDVEGKDQDDSVAVTKIAEEDTVENSSVCLEMEDDTTSASPLQEMQSKQDGSEVNKVTEQLATNERKDNASAMEVRDSVLLNESIKEDDDKNISLYPESEDDNKLANSDEDIQSKPASKGQLPTKEKDDVEDRNQEDSIAITKIVKKDTVENSSESLKTEDDAKSVITHQEIQKKLDGGKATEHLSTDEGKDNAPVMGVRDFVVHNEGTKEDFDMNIFLCPESEDDDKLANSDKGTQSKLASEVITEQLQIKKNVGVAQKKPEKESVSITNNTGEGPDDNSSLQRLERVKDARSANSQQEMQSKLDVIEQLPTNKSVEYVQAKDEDDSVAITNSTKEDNAKSSSIRLETKGDSKLAQQEMQNKIESGGFGKAERKQLPPTRSVKDATAAEGDRGTVVNRSNTKDDNLKLNSLYQETEEAAKLEKFQEKMQSKVDNGTKQLIGEGYVKDALELDDDIGNYDVKKRLSHLKAEYVNFKSAIHQEKLQREVDEEVKTQQDNILPEKSDESCMEYKPHDVEVGSVKNGNQQSNTVKAYKDQYELEYSISKVKQDGSPGLSKIPRPLNSEYQTMIVSNLPKHNQDSLFLGVNGKSRLPKTKDLHIIDDDINQTKMSQENRKYTVERRVGDNGVAQQQIVKYRPRTVPGDINKKYQQDKSTECEDFPENVMDTTLSDIGTRKYVQETARSGISNDRKARTPNSPKKGYRYNDVQQNSSQINRSYLSPSKNVRRNKVIDHVPEDQLSQTQKYSEKVDDKTILNGGKSKQFRSKIPQYQGIKYKGTSSSDEDINPKNNKDVYARSTRNKGTPPNRQDYRRANGQTNQINMVDITNLKSEIDMTSSAESVHADLKTNTAIVTRANYRKREKMSGSCVGNRLQPCKDQNHQILTTKKEHFFQCTSKQVWNKNIGKLKDQRRVTGNESGFYNKIEKDPLVDMRDHDERIPKHCNEIGFDTNDMNFESDSQYEMFEHSNQQRKRRDINTTDAVVPQAEDFDVLQRPNYYSSGGDMIGNPIASSTPIIRRPVLEPVATSTPKDGERLPDDNSNQGKLDITLHIVFI